MINLTSYYKMPDDKWCMQFKFADPGIDDFYEVHDWFEMSFSKDEAWMGWRTDYSTLTAFIATERAYLISLLRWS